MYVIAFYCPLEAAEKVKAAMFAVGAGRIGDYEQCCWQSEGLGQFKPLLGASPTIGCVDHLQKVVELKVELVAEGAVVKAAIKAMIEAHPYEEPAYHVLKSLSLESF